MPKRSAWSPSEVDDGWLLFLLSGGFDDPDRHADLLAREVVIPAYEYANARLRAICASTAGPSPTLSTGDLYPDARKAAAGVRDHLHTGVLDSGVLFNKRVQLGALLLGGTEFERRQALLPFRRVLYYRQKAVEIARDPFREAERQSRSSAPQWVSWDAPTELEDGSESSLDAVTQAPQLSHYYTQDYVIGTGFGEHDHTPEEIQDLLEHLDHRDAKLVVAFRDGASTVEEAGEAAGLTLRETTYRLKKIREKTK